MKAADVLHYDNVVDILARYLLARRIIHETQEAPTFCYSMRARMDTSTMWQSVVVVWLV